MQALGMYGLDKLLRIYKATDITTGCVLTPGERLEEHSAYWPSPDAGLATKRLRNATSKQHSIEALPAIATDLLTADPCSGGRSEGAGSNPA
jgi:hypothetical protein